MSVWVIGGGGHAKVVIATLQASGIEVVGVLDDNADKHGHDVLGVPIVGPVSGAASGEHEAILAIGDNAVRKKVASLLGGARWATAVHPSAVVHTSASLGAGTVVFAGAVIQPDTHLGAHTIVNTGATVDHDCVLADYVHVAPGTHLAGGVHLGDGVFLGVGATVLPGISVGAWTTVGAGGTVVSDLEAGVTAVGVPARPLSINS